MVEDWWLLVSGRFALSCLLRLFVSLYQSHCCASRAPQILIIIMIIDLEMRNNGLALLLIVVVVVNCCFGFLLKLPSQL